MFSDTLNATVAADELVRGSRIDKMWRTQRTIVCSHFLHGGQAYAQVRLASDSYTRTSQNVIIGLMIAAAACVPKRVE